MVVLKSTYSDINTDAAVYLTSVLHLVSSLR